MKSLEEHFLERKRERHSEEAAAKEKADREMAVARDLTENITDFVKKHGLEIRTGLEGNKVTLTKHADEQMHIVVSRFGVAPEFFNFSVQAGNFQGSKLTEDGVFDAVLDWMSAFD